MVTLEVRSTDSLDISAGSGPFSSSHALSIREWKVRFHVHLQEPLVLRPYQSMKALVGRVLSYLCRSISHLTTLHVTTN